MKKTTMSNVGVRASKKRVEFSNRRPMVVFTEAVSKEMLEENLVRVPSLGNRGWEG